MTLATSTHTMALAEPLLVTHGEPGERKPKVFSEASMAMACLPAVTETREVPVAVWA